jgi:hypothetical protein
VGLENYLASGGSPCALPTCLSLRYYSAGERENALQLGVERATRVINGFVRQLNDNIANANQRMDTSLSYQRLEAECAG